MRSRMILVALLALTLAGCSSHDASEDTAASAYPAEPAAATTADEQAGCNDNSDCEDKHYCAKPPGECESDAGECAVKPEICTHNWDPVCGCDGKTYGNACSAAAAGQSIAYKGECRKPEGAGS